ncbi:MAG TPA: hypothetical protein VFT99_07885, partial [Roseiflexaceae bacterium]|nr:hypothetical protein [Roseiflexaceae bacterium]
PDAEIKPPEPMPFLTPFVVRSILELILFSPFLAVLMLLLWRSGVWERNVIREELADEIGTTITPEEYERVKKDGIFRSRRIARRTSNYARALVAAQNELAFRKRHVRIDGHNPESDPIVTGWREEIRRLRAG